MEGQQGHPVVDRFGRDQGFPSDTVFSMVQTGRGELLLGGDFGTLWRYDGRAFSPFEVPDLPHRALTAMCKGSSRIWLGCSRTWIGLNQDNTIGVMEEDLGAENDSITAIHESRDGRVFIGTGLGCVYVHERGNTRLIDRLFSVAAFCEDSRGDLWIAAHKGGLYCLRGKRPQPFAFADRDLSVITVFEDSRQTLWVGTNQGLYMIRQPFGGARSVACLTMADGLANNGINRIVEDAQGDILVASGYGVNRIRMQGSAVVGIETLLSRLPVITLFIDHEQSVWVGTFFDGLQRYRSTPFVTIESMDGIVLYRPCLYVEADGTLWVGSNQGRLLKVNGGRSRLFFPENNIDEMGIRALCRDQAGVLWVGTHLNGFYRLENNVLVRQQKRLNHEADGVRNIFCDSRGRVWIGTVYGLYRYDRGSYTFFDKSAGLSHEYIYQILEDRRGDLWVCSLSGLMRFERGEIARERRTLFLKGTSVLGISEDHQESGVFWVCTEGAGLFRLNGKNVRNIRRKDGLGSDYVFKTMEDGRGTVWFSTRDGISSIRKTELDAFFDGLSPHVQVTPYSWSDGIRTQKCYYQSQNSIVMNPLGALMFTTSFGIPVVDPEHIRINTAPPPVVMDHVYFNGQEVDRAQQEPHYGIKAIRFEFNALTFVSREKARLKFMLEGVDPDWRETFLDGQNHVNYAGMKPGRYVFRVVGCNSSGVWNHTGISFSFELKAFFYETPVFKLLLVVGVVLLGTGGFVGVRKYRYFKRIESRYKGSTLEKDEGRRYLDRLLRHMEAGKPYLDENLSLTTLAEQIAVAPRHLSQIINEHLDTNFNDFINRYRVEEAKRRLKTFNRDVDSILNLCFEVGFNSKTPFYRAFRKHTGKTPLQYLKDMN